MPVRSIPRAGREYSFSRVFVLTLTFEFTVKLVTPQRFTFSTTIWAIRPITNKRLDRLFSYKGMKPETWWNVKLLQWFWSESYLFPFHWRDTTSFDEGPVGDALAFVPNIYSSPLTRKLPLVAKTTIGPRSLSFVVEICGQAWLFQHNSEAKRAPE